MFKANLVLEGGATRGVFTAGVLDFFMEQKIDISNVIGVSAGSCNAVDYVSEQPGRSKNSMIITNKENKFYGFKNIVKYHSYLDMKLLFETFPTETFPFDYDTYLNSDKTCEIVVTNLETGKPDYLTPTNKNEIMEMCRASSSMPVLAPIAYINKVPYLDGGVTDSIPIKRALENEIDKTVVILTQNKNYRKEPISERVLGYCKRKYKNYPNFVKAVENRYKMYNSTVDLINELESKGEIFVFRPTLPPVSRLERNVDKLNEFYNHGYDQAKNNYITLIEYLQK